MEANLKRIEAFIKKHHVMSLATSSDDEISVCNLFYAYKNSSFVVASSYDTTHIKHILKNKKVAGSIVLETKIVGKIEGLQFVGEADVLRDETLEKAYFKAFAYAIALKPTLWKIRVDSFRLTDNKLGFGKKIIWKRV